MKSIRIALIISGVGVIIGLGVVAYLMFLGPDRIQFSGTSLDALMENGFLPALIVILVTLGISGAVMLPFIRSVFPAQIKNGVTTQARVLKVWDTGVSINDNPQVGLLVEIPLPGTFPIQAEVKTVVSRLRAALVRPGVMAEVKYDPQNPKRLQLLSLELDDSVPSSAEARLEELSHLHEKGLISDEEYRQKREEIVKAL